MMDDGIFKAYGQYASEMKRIKEINTDLFRACKAAYALLTGDGQDGTMGHYKDNPVPAMLRAAINKAEAK